MRTEERPAGAGEKILVVGAFGTADEYRNGDILTVHRRSDRGVEVVEHDIWMSDDEYVVYLEDRIQHHDLLEEIEWLKERVAKLEGGRSDG